MMWLWAVGLVLAAESFAQPLTTVEKALEARVGSEPPSPGWIEAVAYEKIGPKGLQ